MKRYFWTGICNEDRTSGISRIEECINKYGFIIDYKFFSDISISMVIEIKERHIKTLYEDLIKIIFITNPFELTSDSENECVILFNITFAKGTGDMIIEVPSVPG
jgi:hypothetical protein